MTVRPPLSFLLVEQASIPHALHAPYAELFDQKEKGQWNPDPLEKFGGVFLVDHALKFRIKNPPQERSWKMHKGADPKMDQLWSTWLSLPETEGYDEQLYLKRLVQLVRAGSSIALEMALKSYHAYFPNREKLGEINQHFRSEFSYPLQDIQDYILDHNLCATMDVLLKEDAVFTWKKENLLKIKSPEMFNTLWERKIFDADRFSEEDLLLFKEGLHRLDLPAKTIVAIYQAAKAVFPSWNSRESQLGYVATGLEKKTQALLELEMKHVNWYPGMPIKEKSPFKIWAQSKLRKNQLSTALPKCKEFPLYGRPNPNDGISDAAWAWLGLMFIDQEEAFLHAQKAEDLSFSSLADQVKQLPGVVSQKKMGVSYDLEEMVEQLLKEVLYADLDIDLIWKDLLEPTPPSSRGWLFDNFEKDEVEGMIIPLANMANEYAQSWSKWSDFAKSSWMSAACWAIIELDEISGVERRFIKESWLRAWGEGVRPLPNHQEWIQSNHHAFAELPECQSLVEQWSLLSQSLSSSGQIKRLRL